MEHRQIGSLSVSVVGLGCNNFGGRMDAAATEKVVSAAIDAGINFFDTADVYGGGLSEEHLGKALAGRRADVLVATKFGAPMSAPEGVKRGSREWIRKAVERSLGRLGSDYIDLYQLHFPDAEVPIADTLGALHELVQEGKVREIGCSNFGSTRLREAADAAEAGALTPFRSVQNRYSVLHRDPEAKVTPMCDELGLGLIPYFPLESGLLSGKYRKGAPLPEGTRLSAVPQDRRDRFLSDESLERVERLRAFAEEHDHSLLDLAISWLVTAPCVVSVIAGATRVEQVAANAAAGSWALDAQQRAAIDARLG